MGTDLVQWNHDHLSGSCHGPLIINVFNVVIYPKERNPMTQFMSGSPLPF